MWPRRISGKWIILVVVAAVAGTLVGTVVVGVLTWRAVQPIDLNDD